MNSKRKISNSLPTMPAHSAGFSLFELVVFIISVAIIYAYAANRFADFPGQAERANFLAISTQLQTAINLEMMVGIGRGRIESSNVVGTNPMEFMLETPSNYLGAFDVVEAERLPRRTWYFDLSRGELVYLVNDVNGVFYIVNGRDVPTDEIRYRITAQYREVEADSGLPIEIAEARGRIISDENRIQRFYGVVMEPSLPFRWGETDPENLITEATTDISG